MTKPPLRIGVVAGEASGDTLGAGMLRSIRAKYPDAIIEGIAGPKMLAEGCSTLFDMEELSVMGLVEVLSRIRRLLFIRKSVLNHFTQNPPDVFIGIDAPDFNLPLEKKLRKQGIKTVHYVSPTVWAWRENRIVGIGQATDLVLSIFPFEKEIYDKHGLACQFVGHTLADEIPMVPDKRQARLALGLKNEVPTLAVLPGSRGGEVNMLLPTFVETIRKLTAQIGNLQVVIPAVNATRKEQIQTFLGEHAQDLDYQVVLGQARTTMIASDAVLLASGTASLEAMLCKRPMVVAYKLKWLTHQMMKKLYKPEYFALPNLLADEKIVPELLQDDVNPENLVAHLKPLLLGEQQQVTEHFAKLHKQLAIHADQASAKAVLDLIHA